MWGEPGLVWLAGGVALLVAEVLAPGTFMMWLGLAAIGTGLLTWLLALSFAWEVVAFAVLAAIAIAAGLRLRRAAPKPVLNTATAGLVGRSARALGFTGREGRVRLGDSDWPARLDAGVASPEAGAMLEVVGVEGMVLVVRPAA